MRIAPICYSDKKANNQAFGIKLSLSDTAKATIKNCLLNVKYDITYCKEVTMADRSLKYKQIADTIEKDGETLAEDILKRTTQGNQTLQNINPKSLFADYENEELVVDIKPYSKILDAIQNRVPRLKIAIQGKIDKSLKGESVHEIYMNNLNGLPVKEGVRLALHHLFGDKTNKAAQKIQEFTAKSKKEAEKAKAIAMAQAEKAAQEAELQNFMKL